MVNPPMQVNNSPNNFPEHLSENYDAGFSKYIPPVGTIPLKFDWMDSIQFEQLCWWLLKKDNQIVDCQRIGGKGMEQDGIDLLAFDNYDLQTPIVFECKCWKDFTTDKLTTAIDKFLEGFWAKPGTKFTLIIAQAEIGGKLAKQWLIERDRLRKVGIITEHTIWTGLQLTELIQRFPSILSKFFPFASIDSFGNEWMQREGFIERLSKALVDPRPAVVKVAQDFIIESNSNIELTHEQQSGNEWFIKQPWLHLHCFWPHKQFYPGSALVSFQRDDLKGASITFNQKWLLKNLISTHNAPLEHEFRPFINGVLPDSFSEYEKYIVDLGNCRCSLPKEGVVELAYAADKFAAVFLDALVQKEIAWGAYDFPFVEYAGIRVAICTMPKNLWLAILEFSQQHDYDNGNTEWHIFSNSRHSLRLYTKENSERYKRGHHGIFHISENLEGLIHGDNVALLWTPPDLVWDTEISPQNWWSCEYALSWVRDQLVPVVMEWTIEQHFKRILFLWARKRKKREKLNIWMENYQIRDLRIKSLLNDNFYKTLGLQKTAETLQNYFSIGNNNFYAMSELSALYRSLIILLKSGRGYLGYITGNLAIHTEVNDHLEVIAIIENRISTNQLKPSSPIIDHTLRAMLEMIGNDDKWLSEYELTIVFEGLQPLMAHHDRSMLIKRHSKWISN